MKIDKLSFITPIEKIQNNKIILKKSYTQKFYLQNGNVISVASRIGNCQTQEDCTAVTKIDDYLLLLVADGIGGMKGGVEASYKTAEIIKNWVEIEDKEILKELNEKTLEDVLNALMYLISTSIPTNSGATLSMSIITPNKTIIANIGDSRTYTIKNGTITLRTFDDSLVFKRYHPQTKEDRNKLRFHKHNHILINSITSEALPNITVTTIDNDDYDILCHVTDGVTDFLSEYLIEKYSKKLNPATTLVNKSTKGFPIYNHAKFELLRRCIKPGEDNATAIIYTKKRTKNNKKETTC